MNDEELDSLAKVLEAAGVTTEDLDRAILDIEGLSPAEMDKMIADISLNMAKGMGLPPQFLGAIPKPRKTKVELSANGDFIQIERGDDIDILPLRDISINKFKGSFHMSTPEHTWDIDEDAWEEIREAIMGFDLKEI